MPSDRDLASTSDDSAAEEPLTAHDAAPSRGQSASGPVDPTDDAVPDAPGEGQADIPNEPVVAREASGEGRGGPQGDEPPEVADGAEPPSQAWVGSEADAPAKTAADDATPPEIWSPAEDGQTPKSDRRPAQPDGLTQTDVLAEPADQGPDEAEPDAATSVDSAPETSVGSQAEDRADSQASDAPTEDDAPTKAEPSAEADTRPEAELEPEAATDPPLEPAAEPAATAEPPLKPETPAATEAPLEPETPAEAELPLEPAAEPAAEPLEPEAEAEAEARTEPALEPAAAAAAETPLGPETEPEPEPAAAAAGTIPHGPADGPGQIGPITDASDTIGLDPDAFPAETQDTPAPGWSRPSQASADSPASMWSRPLPGSEPAAPPLPVFPPGGAAPPAQTTVAFDPDRTEVTAPAPPVPAAPTPPAAATPQTPTWAAAMADATARAAATDAASPAGVGADTPPDGIVQGKKPKRLGRRHSKDGDGSKAGSRRKRRLVWTAVVVAALAGAATGGVLYANHYYADKAAPGVELAGQPISGLTAAEVTAKAEGLINAAKFTFIRDGETAEGALTELGVNTDPQAVADQVMGVTKGAPLWERLNPWSAKPVPIEAQIDPTAVGAFLDKQFITPEETTKDASAQFDAEAGTFELIPSVTGLRTDPAPAVKAVEAYLSNTAAPTAVAIEAKPNPPAVTDQAAQKAVDAANAALGRVVTFTNGQAGAKERTYQLPAGMIGQWTVFTPDREAGALTITYDEALIAEQLPPVLGEQVAIPSRNQITYVYPGTTRQIGVSQWGLNGLKMADPAGVVTQVKQALEAGTDATIEVPLEEDPFETETKEPPSNYDEPGGARWIDVNRSTYWATLYEGTTEIARYVISIGKPSSPTPAGEFYVYLKYEHQVMRGPASDPYESPTDWVSYFNGGVAFHSAPWNEPNNWQRGVSHGCVNMKTRDAKAVFDFAPVGTKVVVHD